jgi:hypothetical protein
MWIICRTKNGLTMSKTRNARYWLKVAELIRLLMTVFGVEVRSNCVLNSKLCICSLANCFDRMSVISLSSLATWRPNTKSWSWHSSTVGWILLQGDDIPHWLSTFDSVRLLFPRVESQDDSVDSGCAAATALSTSALETRSITQLLSWRWCTDPCQNKLRHMHANIMTFFNESAVDTINTAYSLMFVC